MRAPSLELRQSEPYPGVGQDEPRMLRSLLGAARRYSFFLLLFPHSSLHLSLRQSSFCPPHLSLSFLPFFHFSFSCFFLLIRSVYLSSPSFSALFLPSFPLSSSFSRARTRRAFRKRLSHVYAGVCVERTHMRGPLLRAVEGKIGRAHV